MTPAATLTLTLTPNRAPVVIPADVVEASGVPVAELRRLVAPAVEQEYDPGLLATVRHAVYGWTTPAPGWDGEVEWRGDALRQAYSRAGWTLTFAGWTRADIAAGRKNPA